MSSSTDAVILTNIGKLVQCGRSDKALLRGAELAVVACLDDAWLWVEAGNIKAFGSMGALPEVSLPHHDLRGDWVFPAWVDSHTHLVFAESREQEFVDRINGLSYAEIAARGGGILNSAQKLAALDENELFERSLFRLHQLQKLGTGALEIKSGYGLTEEAEIKMLRVVRRLKEASRIPIKATFLGAHALPMQYRDKREAYLDLMLERTLPRLVDEGLADYIDVFCEQGFFTLEETIRVVEAGLTYNLPAKVHVNQFTSQGAIAACVARNAISVDHLEVMAEEDYAPLKQGRTIATLLPSAPFFLRDHYPPARRMVEEGLALALASDYNPGSSPSGNMALVVALACIQCRLLPEEALNAATLNAAAALELSAELGSIDVGKKANFFSTRPLPSLAYLPYSFGENLVKQVWVDGVKV